MGQSHRIEPRAECSAHFRRGARDGASGAASCGHNVDLRSALAEVCGRNVCKYGAAPMEPRCFGASMTSACQECSSESVVSVKTEQAMSDNLNAPTSGRESDASLRGDVCEVGDSTVDGKHAIGIRGWMITEAQ